MAALWGLFLSFLVNPVLADPGSSGSSEPPLPSFLRKTVPVAIETSPSIQDLEKLLLKDGEVKASLFQDLVGFDWFQKNILRSPLKLIFLAVGGPNKKYSDLYLFWLEKFLRRARAQGYRVVYDADSTVAPFISSHLGKGQSLGISGRKERRSPEVLVIENPYLRMQSMLALQEVIISPDSTLGIGLLLEGYNRLNVRLTVFDPTWVWTSALPIWSRQLGLGAHFPEEYDPRVFNSTSRMPSYLLKDPWPSQGIIPGIDLASHLRQLGPGNALSFLRIAENFSDLVIRQSQDQEYPELAVPPGAAFFGSSRDIPEFTSLVSEVVSVLAEKRITITTGGAGGFMRLANEIALKNKAYSIGIPIEETLHRESHHLSLHVNEYYERIPLMLWNRPLAIVAPGGVGTMKELSTTLVMMSTGSGNQPVLFFIGKRYFETLFRWLKGEGTDLGPEITQKFMLVNSREGMEEALQKAIQQFGISTQKLWWTE